VGRAARGPDADRDLGEQRVQRGHAVGGGPDDPNPGGDEQPPRLSIRGDKPPAPRPGGFAAPDPLAVRSGRRGAPALRPALHLHVPSAPDGCTGPLHEPPAPFGLLRYLTLSGARPRVRFYHGNRRSERDLGPSVEAR